MNQRFCNGMVHVIKEGENLYHLSRMYRVPLALILRANPYVDVYNLQVGQEICIPTMRRPMGGMMPPFGARPAMPPQEQPSAPPQEQPPIPPQERPPMPPDDLPPRPMMPSDGARSQEEEEVVSTGEDVVVADGTTSLGDILSRNQISMEEFWDCNDPADVTIAADVAYHLPKKV